MTDLGDWQIFDPGPSVFAESLLWDADREALWWIDIHDRKLHCRGLFAGQRQTWPLNDEPGALCLDSDQNIILGGRSTLWRFHVNEARFEALAPAPFDPQSMRFNDCGVDHQGRLVLSSLYDPKDKPVASLYRVEDRQFHHVTAGVITGNTPVWSPDGERLYWADTRGHQILAFDYCTETGTVSGKQTLWESTAFRPGRPDGMAMDIEGCLWVALFEGQRLLRISPDGELLANHPVPSACPTRPVFAGPKLDRLMLTTAGSARPAEERQRFPASGAILQMPAPVAGVAVAAARVA